MQASIMHTPGYYKCQSRWLEKTDERECESPVAKDSCKDVNEGIHQEG